MSIRDEYQIFYQKTPVMMQSIDSEGILQAVSKKWLDKLGYEEKEVVGKKVFDFLSQSTNEKLLSGLLTLLIDQGSCSNLKIECIRKDGSILEAIASAELVKDENGNLTSITWALYDVNDLNAISQHSDHFKQLKRIKNQLMEERDYLRDELAKARERYPLISQTKVMDESFEKINSVAKTDANVLILGETGVGKELVAQTIVQKSNRCSLPFITFNCSTTTKDLFESTLFGHVKGAFTGAVSNHKGLWELADGGTILLDEIGEIPIDMQAKLLRAIQNKEYQRVGDSETKKVDIRIIAATNRNLEEMIEQGYFREDLYYRLNVFPLEIPPLRERKDDIPILTRHFLDQACNAFNKDCYGLNEQTISLLQAYNWPGNIRELKNVVERSVILSKGKNLIIDSSLVKEHFEPIDPVEAIATMHNREFLTTDEIKHLERESIIAALNKANWKISGKNSASEYLGINASTLNSKISTLGIKKN